MYEMREARQSNINIRLFKNYNKIHYYSISIITQKLHRQLVNVLIIKYTVYNRLFIIIFFFYTISANFENITAF